jgi:hypothetical protein
MSFPRKRSFVPWLKTGVVKVCPVTEKRASLKFLISSGSALQQSILWGVVITQIDLTDLPGQTAELAFASD